MAIIYQQIHPLQTIIIILISEAWKLTKKWDCQRIIDETNHLMGEAGSVRVKNYVVLTWIIIFYIARIYFYYWKSFLLMEKIENLNIFHSIVINHRADDSRMDVSVKIWMGNFLMDFCGDFLKWNFLSFADEALLFDIYESKYCFKVKFGWNKRHSSSVESHQSIKFNFPSLSLGYHYIYMSLQHLSMIKI